MSKTLTEEQKQAMAEKRQATIEAKKLANSKPATVVLSDGTKRKVIGFYSTGYNHPFSRACYSEGKFDIWVEISKIDRENKIYYV